MKIYVPIFIVIFALHFILQFIAFAFSPGNTAVDLTNTLLGKHWWWPIFSFPLFWFVPKDGSNLYVWIIFFSNSIIWGTGLTFLISLLFKKS